MAIGVGGGKLTPGLSSLSQLRRRVLNYVQAPNDADLIAAANDAINDAINVLNSRTWNWNLREQSITFSAATGTYTVNSNFKKPRKLQILNSDSRVVGHLDYVEPKSFLDDNSFSTSDGDPQQYCIVKPKQDLLLTLDPVPSSSWVAQYPTGKLYYYARVQQLADAADVPDIVPEAEPFIVWYAREDISASYGDASMTDRALRKQQMIWGNLVRDDNREQTDWIQDMEY